MQNNNEDRTRYETEYYIGLSLAQGHERTAVAIVERITPMREEISWSGGISYVPADVPPRFQCSHMERVPMLKRLPSIASDLVNRTNELGSKAHVVVDITMAGKPVAELLKRAGLKFTSVILSNGDRSARSDGITYIPKRELISNMVVMLQEGNIQFAKSDTRAAQLQEEMFRYKENKTGSNLEAAQVWRENANDDLLFAVCMAAWKAHRGAGIRFDESATKLLASLCD